MKAWEEAFEVRCQQAVKHNRVVWCINNCPLTGKGRKIYKHETGRKIKGDGDWIMWTPEQLATRKAFKESEQAKMQPIVAEIRAKYPALMPDPA